ncbi:MAG TPA: GMC family oxidoreductase [Steroidobacteraceae bacterium]|jgi:choline dehydrogenase-like flavoprotein
MIRTCADPGDPLAGCPPVWDLCIVGAGAAGLALAAEFLGTRWRVLVLESGMREPDAGSTALNSLDCVGLRHDGWNEGRVRAFGGTTRAWGGQLVPLRESELAERPWVPGSGWPLTLDEFQPYYRRVEHLLGTQGPPYDEQVWQRIGVSAPTFEPGQLLVRFSQWAPLGRRNFAVLLRRQLEASGNVTVLLGATATAVRCLPDGGHCDSIIARNLDGSREIKVHARSFVVACGGLESARLLLSSPGPGDRGVANGSGCVGRYFQDHISWIAGELEPAARSSVQHLFDPRYVGGTLYSVKVEPTDAQLQRRGWLNAMGHVAFQIPEALGWMEVRRILRSLQAGRLELPSGDELRALLRGSVELSRLVLARYFARRRRSPTSGAIRLLVDVEQAPNPESRLTLVDRTDALGVRRARLDWRLTDLESRTLTEFARTFATQLEHLGLGRVRLAEGPPDFSARDTLGAARDIFHHMGTTRMSRSPEEGVTRPDLRCHDVDNLYIAGPSVFPTSGIANPTFTALALSLRLADHLKASK